MAKRMRRGVAIAVSLIAATGLIAGPAAADQDAVEAAQEKLAKIQQEQSQADADYGVAEDAYETAKLKLEQAEKDIAAQEKKVAELKSDLAQLALMRYQSGGIDITAQLLDGEDEGSFLNSLATIDSVSTRTNSSVQDVQVEQAGLDRLRQDAADAEAEMAAQKEAQAKQVEKLDEQEAEAQKVLDDLEADERERLLALQNRESATATAAASSAVSTEDFGSGASGSAKAEAAVQWAISQLGDPYVFASSGPNSFDCSGLTSGAYASVGISLPHLASSQFNVGTPVDRADLQPGDLLFFYPGITHVGIYVGNGVMVHSSPNGGGVHYSNLATYPSYQGARRVA